MNSLIKIASLSFLLIFLSGCSKDSDGDFEKNSPIYLANNGVTIKCNDFAKVGDTVENNGNTFIIVDENTLRERVANGDDLTKVCTCKITDMSELFFQSSLNQNISTWDVSNVTDMSRMFSFSEFNQDINL